MRTLKSVLYPDGGREEVKSRVGGGGGEEQSVIKVNMATSSRGSVFQDTMHGLVYCGARQFGDIPEV